ncbi:hypothetical protein DAEQUDRAFT_783064 [Daedalea quercina L-15889]|uniref:DUF302 domain-containing protein n=1 Tax=Daedalea quercina L-15889 TaxID=1314783 RepID=A0A165KHK7_9APHY|nr:hypothetical protein DAEQUDRAFT_783064 [Daedalea quercina L-15889]
MSKTVHDVLAKRVIFDTSLPFDEVTARLDVELSREKAGPQLIQLLGTVKTREKLEQGLQEISGGKDFVLFAASSFENWRNAYHNQTVQVPKARQYILGNPLIAETMIAHDPYVPLGVPPRVLVAEKTDKSGTQIVYYLPSSIIAVSVDGNVKPELKAAAEILDAKLEALVTTIIAACTDADRCPVLPRSPAIDEPHASQEAEGEHEPGTSVSTIRGLRRLNIANLSMSASSSSDDTTVETGEPTAKAQQVGPSPPHSELPSPSSPSGDSVSSFPSEISSSFLFSSGPGSPPHSGHTRHSSLHGESDGELHDSTRGLIIPSLTLPAPAKLPTPYGQTLGDLRLLVLASRRAAASTAALVAHLLEENDDIVELGVWEEEAFGADDAAPRVTALRASTNWVEHRDAHGLEHTEPARNVEVVELPGYDPSDDAETILGRVLPAIHSPFQQVSEALHPEYAPSAILANLLSSGSTPLYTALILLLTSSPTLMEKSVLDALSPHVPVIVLPPLPAHPTYPFQTTYPLSNTSSAYSSPIYSSGSNSPCTTASLSFFRPATPHALRTGLFRTPETLARLRGEAAARFLRWREVERAVEKISPSASADTVRAPKSPVVMHARTKSAWDKAQWEAEWEGMLSQEIAVELRQRRRADTALAPVAREEAGENRPPAFSDLRVRRGSQCAPAPFDPLHVGSLFMFSLSLLGPLKSRVAQSLSFGKGGVESTSRATTSRSMGVGLGVALVGAFCAGIGLGLLIARV